MAIAQNPNPSLFRGLSRGDSLPRSPKNESFKRIGRDAAYDPFWHRYNYLKNEGDQLEEDLIGYLIPAHDMVPREELYGASWTPKGRFVTWVAVVNAFHNGWFFTQTKKKREPLNPRLEDRLIALTSDYDLKFTFILARWLSRVFGQALWIKMQVNPKGMKKKYVIRVVPIWKEMIQYDNDGNITEYRPVIPVGTGSRQFYIDPKDAVLWVHNPDPFDDPSMGISELLSVYRTIKRSESIAQAYAELIYQKGLGQLDIEIEGINTIDDAKKWADLYKRLVQDSIVVHSPEMKTTLQPGINSGYNYNSTQESYYEDVAAGTGFPQMRMRGVQTGTVTGSETDQDNMAEIMSGIQEGSEKFMKACYLCLDPEYLTGKSFEIDWKFEIKMDQTKKSNKLATDINTILAGSRILTVNQAMAICDLALIDGPEGDMILQQWIDLNFPVEMPEEQPVEPSPSEETGETMAEETGEAKITTGGDSMLVVKRKVAKALLDRGLTIRPVYSILKQVFDSGISPNDLCAIRDKKLEI